MKRSSVIFRGRPFLYGVGGGRGNLPKAAFGVPSPVEQHELKTPPPSRAPQDKQVADLQTVGSRPGPGRGVPAGALEQGRPTGRRK